MKDIKLLMLFGLFAWLGFASATVPGKVPAQAYEAVNGALQAWKLGNWEKMYGFLSVQDKNKTPLSVFIKKRSEIAIIEKLVSYSIVSGRAASDGSVYVTLNLTILKKPVIYVPSSSKWTSDKVTTTWHLVCMSRGVWKISFATITK